MENSDLSSASNLTVDTKSIDRSLTQIRKKRDTDKDPCGKPALTGTHSNTSPFKITP